MNKTGKRVLLVIGGAALATTLVAGGRHYCGDHEYRADWMVHKISEELELNDAQQVKLKNLRDVVLESKKRVHEGRKDVRDSVLELLSQTELDRQQALDLISKRTEDIRAQAPQIVDAIGEFYDSLNEEQREELREHVEEKMGHRPFGYHS